MTDWHVGSRQRLTHRDLPHFAGTTLFDRVGRVLCGAEVLPRKELFETWSVVKAARRRLKGRPVLDLASGHGLAAWLMLLLDPRAPRAIALDKTIPPSAATLEKHLVAAWPQLEGRCELREGRIEDLVVGEPSTILAIHACGGLTDLAMDQAISSGSHLAALPCCHSHRKLSAGGLEGWFDRDVAIDATRVGRLREGGYRVWTRTIDEAITPENRLFLAEAPPLM